MYHQVEYGVGEALVDHGLKDPFESPSRAIVFGDPMVGCIVC